MIPYGRQCIEEDDIKAVVEVLRSDYLTTGPYVEKFEAAFAEFINSHVAVAVSSGTAALHLALIAMGVRPGDRVITSPNTFASTANAIAFCGGIPDFCDINASGNMCLESLKSRWSDDCVGIIAVDYAGQPPDMKQISEFVRSKSGFVIEDSCHGVGTSFKREGHKYFTGAHPWADMSIFSFHPVKTLTTGEGGMITTNNRQLGEEMRRLRHHGIERTPSNFENLPNLETGPWFYEMQQLGFNYRLTDLQCALGISQLTKLKRFIQRRQQIVDFYNEKLHHLDWFKVPEPEAWMSECEGSELSWHLYSPQLDFVSLGKSRTEVMKRLSNEGVGSQVLYIPVYLQPWYRKTFGYLPGKCPLAESFYEHSLSLPLYPSMKDSEVERVVEVVSHLQGKR